MLALSKHFRVSQAQLIDAARHFRLITCRLCFDHPDLGEMIHHFIFLETMKIYILVFHSLNKLINKHKDVLSQIYSPQICVFC